MASAGRTVASAVAAALVAFLASCGYVGTSPAASGGGLAGTGSADTASGGITADAGVPSGAASGIVRADAADQATSSAGTAPESRSGRTHADLLPGAVSYVTGRAGTVLAAVYDVRTGQSWRFGAGPAQAEASVVKLDILEVLLAAQGDTAPSAGEQSLTRSMIEESDNDAATSLWVEAGGAPGIGAYNGRAGLTKTTPSACVTCAGFAWPGWGLTTTTPDDQLELLKQLITPGPRPLLSGTERSYALSLMENVASDQRWGVSGGVPAGVTVALKNGWLPLDDADTDWQVNSVGWVSGDGRDYLIAVLTTGNPTKQYGIDTISTLSSLIWTAMR